ncbi:AfsR/SARP family transcriptional regulator [Micromonospora sp. NBS 11-29]|uniref:AfsR/SARP family transcriptional regulator n=1 Tax=Micromonospora sp. NBS 11-29 TaxID=1960879 RepID=UPI001C38F518|nr:BTAD domain-containing putative transcriptional regulator [Micromonospora sp. NBS 11-29]
MSSEGEVRFAVLGPVRAWRGAEEIVLGAPQQRAVLASLLVRAGEPVGLGEIVDVLWGDDPPSTAVNVVHRHVGVLRRLLEPDLPVRSAGRWLVRSAGGYRLDAASDAVDVLRFRELARRARQAVDVDAGRAAALFAEALELWHGGCAAGIDPEARAHPVFAAVEREFLAAARDAADAGVRAGQVHRLLPALREAVVRAPLDEPLHAGLMLALAAAGQQAEALAVHQRVRARLADELGVDPGVELASAHAMVLRGTVARSGVRPPEPAPRPRPAQLPAAPATFVGRRAELARALRLHSGDERAATVVISAIGGMAGVGKTTLAVHLAHQLAHRYPDGQLYVNLRGFDPSGVVLTPERALLGFLEALDVPPQSVPAGLDERAALFRSRLAGRRVLVVLDNARDVDQVVPLLPGAAGCLVLVTSRNQLSGLVATHGAHPLPLDLLSVAESRDLLARRLGTRRVTAEPEAVEEIIARCGRLPLALAIVAAHAVTNQGFPLSAITADLGDAHGSLRGFAGPEAAVDARAVFSWSYETLSPDAARLFRLLALHPEVAQVGVAAVASLAAMSPDQARAGLAELVRANLVVSALPGRYAFHDLLRAYATEVLHAVETDEQRHEALHRVLDHYLHTAHAACRSTSLNEPHPPDEARPGVVVDTFADGGQAEAWLVRELPALIAAVRRAERAGFDAHAWQLPCLLTEFLDRRGRWDDWYALATIGARAAERVADPVARAHSSSGLAMAADAVGRTTEAVRCQRYAVELYAGRGDQAGEASALRRLANVLDKAGRYAESLASSQRALSLFEAVGDRRRQALTHNTIGWTYALSGDHRQGIAHCERAIALLDGLGHTRGEAATWDSLGYAHQQLGHHRQAIDAYRRSADLRREVGDLHPQAVTLDRLGDVYRDAGDLDAARGAWRQASAILADLRDPAVDRVGAKLDPAPRTGR